MNGCIYKTEDGLCEKYSGDGVVSWCVEGPCTDYRPSKADNIRAMTDEELVVWLAHITECPRCPARREHCGLDCHSAWLDWLKQEVEVTKV